jgi:Arc/MetJ family transcription regulator
MRTNIEIDDELLQQAMRCTGACNKEAVVEAGLRLLVEIHDQTGIRRLRGKVRWRGKLVAPWPLSRLVGHKCV